MPSLISGEAFRAAYSIAAFRYRVPRQNIYDISGIAPACVDWSLFARSVLRGSHRLRQRGRRRRDLLATRGKPRLLV